MWRKLKALLVKYRELITYGIFGAGATLINIFAFYLFAKIMHMPMLPANVLAWVMAFAFAFITNKLWVFESKSWKGTQALKEMWGFFLVRIATLFLDTALMYLFINVFFWNDMFSKIVDNIVVIIINYVASKFWIFKRNDIGEKE